MSSIVDEKWKSAVEIVTSCNVQWEWPQELELRVDTYIKTITEDASPRVHISFTIV